MCHEATAMRRRATGMQLVAHSQRDRAVRAQLAHYQAMRELADAHGKRWGALATSELIRSAPRPGISEHISDTGSSRRPGLRRFP